MPSCGVRLSVTFVYSVKTSKPIFKFFLPSDSHTILVLPYQTFWQYSDGDPRNRASKAGGVGKNRDSGFITCCQRFDRQLKCNTHSCVGRWKIGDTGKRRSLLFTGDGRRSVYDKKLRRYAEDSRTELNNLSDILKPQ